jgi:hypothetical protein
MSCKNTKQHSLADSLKDYLSKVMGIFKSKKQINVKLCAKATDNDKEQLLSLLTKKDAKKKIDWNNKLTKFSKIA